MRYAAVLVLGFALGTASAVRADERTSGGAAFYVIVNASRSINELDRKFLADVFLKRIKHWPQDGLIVPVDLRPDSEARYRFSETVLGRSVLGVRGYWQQLIFSGEDVPPPELPGDVDVFKFVVNNPDAIGYVSAAFLTDGANAHGVRTVAIR